MVVAFAVATPRWKEVLKPTRRLSRLAALTSMEKSSLEGV
jgi:hypothetical protein